MENDRSQEEANALCSAINSPSQASGLPGQMKAEVEGQEVLVDAASHLSDCFLGDGCEYGITKLLEEGGANARQAI